jgi:hypothetical protein
MGNTIKFTGANRPVLTQAEELEHEANEMLADAEALEAQAGKLLVMAAKMRRVSS